MIKRNLDKRNSNILQRKNFFWKKFLAGFLEHFDPVKNLVIKSDPSFPNFLLQLCLLLLLRRQKWLALPLLQSKMFPYLRHIYLKLFLPVGDRNLAAPTAAFCTIRLLVQALGQLNRVWILLRLIQFFVKSVWSIFQTAGSILLFKKQKN